MAEWAVRCRFASIALACRAFSISETCYRYQPKLSYENEMIADWLGGITSTASRRCKITPRDGYGYTIMTGQTWELEE